MASEVLPETLLMPVGQPFSLLRFVMLSIRLRSNSYAKLNTHPQVAVLQCFTAFSIKTLRAKPLYVLAIFRLK
jgi:hypothetical protein